MNTHAGEMEGSAPVGRLDVLEETCKVTGCNRHALFVQEYGAFDRCSTHARESQGIESLVTWCRDVVEHWVRAKLSQISHAYLEGAEFVGAPEEPLEFPSGLNIVESNLDCANFENAVLEDARIHARYQRLPDHSSQTRMPQPLVGTSFFNTSLRGTSFCTDLMNVKFEGSDLTDVEFHGVVEYSGLLLHDVQFFNSTISELALRKCSLSNVSFDGTLIGKLAIDDGCTLENVDLGRAVITPRQLTIRDKVIVNAGCTIPAAFRPFIEELRKQGKVEGEFSDYVPQTPVQRMFALAESIKARPDPPVTPRVFSTTAWLSASAIATVLFVAIIHAIGIDLSATGRAYVLASAAAVVGMFRILRCASQGDGLCHPG